MAVQREEVIKRLSLCARCRQCRIVCEIPIAQTMLPICPSGDYFKFDSYYASGRITVAKKILLGQIDLDESIVKLIYSCTLCKSCAQQCPIFDLDPLEATNVLRQLAVEAGLADDIYPMPSETPLAGNWDAAGQGQTVALFAGCEAQSDVNTVERAAHLLESQGISFRVLAGLCCGGYLLRKGDQHGFKQRMAQNIERFKDAGISKIITLDPMCFKVLKEDYNLSQEGIETVYYLDFLQQATAGKSKPTPGCKVAYHDPCYLGRYLGYYDFPRQVIGQIPGVEMVEFKRNRENSLCCGGAPDWIKSAGDAVAIERIKEAEEIGAEMVVSACSNCAAQLSKASRIIGSKVVVKDLLALLEEAYE